VTRIPITRRDLDGTLIDGTAQLDEAEATISDFRDLDGVQLVLPPGSQFEFALPEGWRL
jgi:3-deoxy-D-manno-octulosonate 8-phosphate phosphatase KdsC-like HAD superfamily phosphatase